MLGKMRSNAVLSGCDFITLVEAVESLSRRQSRGVPCCQSRRFARRALRTRCRSGAVLLFLPDPPEKFPVPCGAGAGFRRILAGDFACASRIQARQNDVFKTTDLK